MVNEDHNTEGNEGVTLAGLRDASAHWPLADYCPLATLARKDLYPDTITAIMEGDLCCNNIHCQTDSEPIARRREPPQ